MAERGAVDALKASFRGALRANGALPEFATRVDALAEGAAVDPALLDDLARVAAAAALASSALRGLCESLSARERTE